jgi:hypothetical protein
MVRRQNRSRSGSCQKKRALFFLSRRLVHALRLGDPFLLITNVHVPPTRNSHSPTGMLARSGSYAVRSRVIDDDGKVYADFEWTFKLAKEW